MCFGSNSSVCPIENLYRIIGVFDNKVKLIKSDFATKEILGINGDYYGDEATDDNTLYMGNLSALNWYNWNYKNDTTIKDNAGSIDWTTSLLNKVNLNTNYLNYLGDSWTKKIADSSWYIGGYDNEDANAKEFYQGEIVNSTKIYQSKIGLMYVSDYMFAALESEWTKGPYDYIDNRDDNWLTIGTYDWTITPVTESWGWPAAWYICKEGDLAQTEAGLYGISGIRPTFYLNSDVKLVSGTGTLSDPYRIS